VGRIAQKYLLLTIIFIQSFRSSRRHFTLHSTFLIGKLAVEFTLVEFLFLEVISAKNKALMMNI